jgi:hypothetical protein
MLVVRSLAVDEIKGCVQSRMSASVEATIASLPDELQDEWAEEWRAELAANITMPLTTRSSRAGCAAAHNSSLLTRHSLRSPTATTRQRP